MNKPTIYVGQEMLRPYTPWPGSKSVEQIVKERNALIANESKAGLEAKRPPAPPKTTTGATPGPVGRDTTEGALPHLKIPGVKTTYGSTPKLPSTPSPKAPGPGGAALKPKG